MKAKITYARLQERVATAAGIHKKEAQTLLKEMTAAVNTGLVADGKVNLAGLGRFNRKIQSARRGRNPQTGEPIDIPEKNRVEFLPEAQWRRRINRKFEHIPVVPESSPEPPVLPATLKTPQPRQTGPALQPVPAKPSKSHTAGTVAPTPSPPASSAAEAGDITMAEATGQKRGNKLAPAIGMIALVVVALFFLWPRSQPALPPVTPRPLTTSRAAQKPPPLPETSQPEPGPPPLAETATVHASIATIPAAETAGPTSNAPKPVTVANYTVTGGDTLWQIADDVYHYPYFWPVIFQENHQKLIHPDALIVGMQLAIPAFKGRVGQLTESDFQQLADGYLRVYRAYQRNRHPQAPYYLWVAYRLRAHWVPENEMMPGELKDLKFIRQLKGRGLIH